MPTELDHNYILFTAPTQIDASTTLRGTAIFIEEGFRIPLGTSLVSPVIDKKKFTSYTMQRFYNIISFTSKEFVVCKGQNNPVLKPRKSFLWF